MGVYAGIIIGGFAGYVADEPTLGWRWAFASSGILGVVYALPLFLLLFGVWMGRSTMGSRFILVKKNEEKQAEQTHQ
jgi:MFS family permease